MIKSFWIFPRFSPHIPILFLAGHLRKVFMPELFWLYCTSLSFVGLMLFLAWVIFRLTERRLRFRKAKVSLINTLSRRFTVITAHRDYGVGERLLVDLEEGVTFDRQEKTDE
jgi:hypothetical protein